MSKIRILVSALVVSSVLVVSDVAAQAHVGIYTLRTVNEGPLPVLMEDEPGTTCSKQLLEAELELYATGAYELRYQEQETCNGVVDDVDDDEVEGVYVIEGERIVFSEADESDDRPDELDVDELGIGVLSGSELRITLQDKRNQLVFTR